MFSAYNLILERDRKWEREGNIIHVFLTFRSWVGLQNQPKSKQTVENLIQETFNSVDKKENQKAF